MADTIFIYEDGTGIKIDSIISRNDGDSANAILTSKILTLPSIRSAAKKWIAADIGAAQGWWTALACKCGFITIAFEPDVSGAALFKQNMIDNGYMDKFILMECAVSNKNETQTMKFCGESSYIGKHVSESNSSELFVEKQIPTVRFEDIFTGLIAPFLDESIYIPLMKIDTEGHEPDVIDGMLNMLSTGHIQNIITEFTTYWYGETKETAIIESESLIRKISTYLPYIYMLSRRGEIIYFGPMKPEQYNSVCARLYDMHLQVDIAFLSEPIDASYGLKVIDIDKTDLVRV